MKKINVSNIDLKGLDVREMSDVNGGGFGPFGFGFRVFMKPAFLVSEHWA
ncbi:hypothetical protein [Sphingobacterium psychroaquaticum]|uniref:Uncharacterized protein n=1 Tax=Sphingobacterium psychroaquaticum TaxID=561061 RepID=A0A1X7KXP2_9SPHI|nr:hypothetical protein [Sphingobacterium psychroaquaticum]SMG46336.1 hypothetical protein SAMN05660862_3294 [Sphingobacterium psychroaquaticum]